MSADPKLLFEPAEIDRIVDDLAEQLSATYPDGVVLVGVLKGSVVFLADLARRLTTEALIDFLAVSPYVAGTGRVRLLKDLDLDVSGRDVVLVEEIVDTGLTVAFLRASIKRRGAASVEVCTLLDRAVARIVPVELGFVGATVSDDFLIGYGLDHEGRYRNTRSIALADEAVLAADPDAYVGVLYGNPAPH